MKGWIVFSMGVLLFACASGKDLRILDKDLDRLQSRINILQRENDSTKNEISDMRAKNQNLRADLSLRLKNLQSEVRTLSTSVEEYKEFLKRPIETDRFKEEMEGRLRSSEEREKRDEEKFVDLEDRLKGLDEKTTGLTSKPTESEGLAPTKEISSELKFR